MAHAFLAKLGIAVAKEPKGALKIVKKIAIFIVSFLLLIGTICSNFLSFFAEEGSASMTDNYTESRNYKELMKVYREYMDDTLMPELKSRQQELYYEHKESKFSVHMNEINPAYLMAYYTTATDDFKAGKGKVDRSVAYMFFNYINRITYREVDDEEFIVFNAFATPEETGAIFFEDAETYGMFLLSFEFYTEYVGTGNISVSGLYGDYGGAGDLTSVPNTGMGIPIFYQNDYRSKYGTGTISSSGCAPTCIAMILSFLKQKIITPPDVVDVIGSKYYVPGAGSSWEIFQGCADLWDVKSSNLGRNLQKVLEELKAGHPVIASMAPGMFTSSGHFIVIRGSTTDGYFLVNDPNKNNVSKYKTDKFEITKVFPEVKNFWSIYK